MPPKHQRYRWLFSASKVSGITPLAHRGIHVQPGPAGPQQAQRQLGVLGDAPLVPAADLLHARSGGSVPWCRRRSRRRARCGTAARPRRSTCTSSRAGGSTPLACPVAVVLRRLDEAHVRRGEERNAAAQEVRVDLVVGVDHADDLGAPGRCTRPARSSAPRTCSPASPSGGRTSRRARRTSPATGRHSASSSVLSSMTTTS